MNWSAAKNWGFSPVDGAPLVALRLVFAALVLFSTVRFASYGWIESQIVDPEVTFPFWIFASVPRPGWWNHGPPRMMDILTRASPLIGEWPRAHYRFPDGKLPRGPGCPTHGLWVAGVRPGVFSEIMEIEEGG